MVGLSLNLRADRSLALNFMWLPWRLNWYLSTLKVNMELAFGMAIYPATVGERVRERERRGAHCQNFNGFIKIINN